MLNKRWMLHVLQCRCFCNPSISPSGISGKRFVGTIDAVGAGCTRHVVNNAAPATMHDSLKYCEVSTMASFQKDASSMKIPWAFLLSPPPPYPLSVHKGFRIQASLCVTRVPLVFSEVDYEREWRQFREAWQFRTGNQLHLDQEILTMKHAVQALNIRRSTSTINEYPNSQKRPVNSDVQALQREISEKSESSQNLVTQFDDKEDELERLLAMEGFSLSTQLRQSSNLDEKFTSKSSIMDEIETEKTDEDMHFIKRKKNSWVHLIVKYSNAEKWHFPIVDRIHTHSMRQTLKRLCAEQFGTKFTVHFLGFCPFAFEKKKYPSNNLGFDGRKIFYYRSYVVPGEELRQPEMSSAIQDYAWVTRSELQKYFNSKQLHCVKTGLILD